MKIGSKNIRKAYIVNTVLVIVVFVLDVLGIFNKETLNTDIGSFVTSMIAISFGFYYLVNNYRKNAAENYKYFLLFFGLNELIQLYGELYYLALYGKEILVLSSIASFSLVFILIMLAILLVSKDLGYKISSTLSYLILLLTLINFVIACVAYSNSSSYVLLTFNQVVLSCVTCIFIVAKYNDKALRNTN